MLYPFFDSTYILIILGIVVSMFTAIFVSRTAFGLWLGGNDGKKLSI